MSAAEREAERRFPPWLPTGDYEIDREDYSELDAKWQNADTERDRAHFVQGAEWQAERDADRIAELEAEIEQWRRVAVEQTRLERDRAEDAEARLDAVRAYCAKKTEGMPDDPFAYGIQELRRVLALLAEFPMLTGVTDGCRCIPHEQDAGGGYTEYLLEYEPSCPEHSEHLYDPRSGEWVLRQPSVTDELVEAGAQALHAFWNEQTGSFGLTWQGMPEVRRNFYRAEARAVLEAVYGKAEK